MINKFHYSAFHRQILISFSRQQPFVVCIWDDYSSLYTCIIFKTHPTDRLTRLCIPCRCDCPLMKKGKTTQNKIRMIQNNFKSINTVGRGFRHAGSNSDLYFGLSLFHFMVRSHQSSSQFNVKIPNFQEKLGCQIFQNTCPCFHVLLASLLCLHTICYSSAIFILTSSENLRCKICVCLIIVQFVLTKNSLMYDNAV